MSTSALLLIALASVVLLLLLVIKAKAHPFVALLIVSLLVASATGIPADKIITTIEKGMGGLLGHIASIIILGSMLGVLIEMSGGAESLAKTLTGVLGAKRTIAALTIVAFILGTPVFFEVGFIIIIPLIYGFSKVAHVSPLKFGLPMAGVMLTVHVALPTHPGAAAAAGILHSDVGWLMLAGIGGCPDSAPYCAGVTETSVASSATLTNSPSALPPTSMTLIIGCTSSSRDGI